MRPLTQMELARLELVHVESNPEPKMFRKVLVRLVNGRLESSGRANWSIMPNHRAVEAIAARAARLYHLKSPPIPLGLYAVTGQEP